jgi:NAD(P)-dependent dehydrogenase (short-subunit alcohol dehydrogenase family)
MAAIVVTGTRSGIGRACAIGLANAGYTVYAGVRRPADADELHAEHASIRPLILDVGDDAAVDAAAKVVEQAGEPLAGVVNNAGLCLGAPIEAQPIEDMRRMLEVNVLGAVRVTQGFLPLLRASRGRVVFVGAAAGRVALPMFGAYSASKFAIEAVADALRVELHPAGVRVSIVEPGAIDTPIFAASTRADLAEGLRQPAAGHYGDALAAMAKAAEDTHARALPPTAVAEVVLEALTAANPKSRYPVGTDAKLLSWFARLLPDGMRDALLAHEIGLSR